MARIRTVKPEFWTDSFMVQVPPLARLVYVALWTAADDHGYIADEPDRLAMELMPREDPLEIDAIVQMFWAAERIDRFESPDGAFYWRVSKWEEHQRPSHPAASKIVREGSRKLAIPLRTRRAVAEKYGCAPGESIDVDCYYCGASGQVCWHRLYSGKPSSWVTFPGLELDHFVPEAENPSVEPVDFVLACRSCNRSKGAKDPIHFTLTRNSSRILGSPPEPSGGLPPEQGTGNREQGTSSSSQHASKSEPTDPVDDDDFDEVIDRLVEARCHGRNIDNHRGYRATVRAEAIRLDGPTIRDMLNAGFTIDAIVASIIDDFNAATPSSVPWCDSSCATCHGDAWIDTGNGLAPCPNRTKAA